MFQIGSAIKVLIKKGGTCIGIPDRLTKIGFDRFSKGFGSKNSRISTLTVAINLYKFLLLTFNISLTLSILRAGDLLSYLLYSARLLKSDILVCNNSEVING